MILIKHPKTLLGQKLKLFFLMFVQLVGYAFFVSINFKQPNDLAIGILFGIVLAVAYAVLVFRIYLNKTTAKTILTYIALILISLSLYFPIIPKLISGIPLRAPGMFQIDERLIPAVHIFSLKQLWPNLIIIFCGSLILNMLRRHTLLKLWDRTVAGRRDHADTRISLGNSLTLGIFLWLSFYTILIALPNDNKFAAYWQHLFFGDHIIYYIMILIFWWAIALIVSDYLATRREIQHFQQVQQVFQAVSFNQVRQSESLTLLKHIEEIFYPVTHSRVIYRIHNLLKVILDGKSHLLEENFLRTDDIDFQATENARGFIGTLLWSLPMIGFMGTIMGIIQTIGKFTLVIGGKGQTVELTDSLAGLSLAFETTLIGLVTALVAGYISALVRRHDEQLNVAFSQFCHEEIISKAVVNTENSGSNHA